MAPDPSVPFTPLGEPAIERRVARDLDRIVAEVGAERVPGVTALVLGGGYGRGEGGGVETDGRWQPSNDYDLFAVVRGVPVWRMPALRAALAALGRRLEDRLGVEVELAPVRWEALPRLEFTMMWCELIAGHRVLVGPPDVLSRAPSMPEERLPLVEVTEYLANRAALLLWVQLDELPPERVWKFVHKTWLAVVSAAVSLAGRFRVGYGRRLEALTDAMVPSLAGVDRAALIERGGEATSYRLRPTPAPPDPVLAGRVEEARAAVLAAWRAAEERRTGTVVGSWSEYAGRRRLYSGRRCPAAVVRHLRVLGARGLVPLGVALEPVRGRVLRSLPALLADRRPHGTVGTAIGLGSTSWEAQARHCLELWRRV